MAKKTENKNVPSVPAVQGHASIVAKNTSGGVAKFVAEMKENLSGLYYPDVDPTYIITEQVERIFHILVESAKDTPQNVSLVGPHGCGKTEMGIQFAARHNLPCLIMNCANLREPRDWFGYRTAVNGSVFWIESLFDKSVTKGNVVIIFDELNRAAPNILNTLMPLLDARRKTYLEEKGADLAVGPNTFFFATLNEGIGYSGTNNLDFAIRDRFSRIIEVDFLPADDETKLLVARTKIDQKTAKALVDIANNVRKKARGINSTFTQSVSTRQLLAAAADFKHGGVETLMFTLANHFTPDGGTQSERYQIIQLIQGKFGEIKGVTATTVSTATMKEEEIVEALLGRSK